MKKITLYMLFITLMCPMIYIKAQEKRTVSNVRPKNVMIKRENGNLNINMDVALNDLKLKSQLMLYLTPIIVNGTDTVEFQPLVLNGNRRNKSLERLIDFDGYEYKNDPQEVIKYKKGEEQIYSFSETIPYQEWMRDATLLLLEEAEGCACRDEYSDTVNVIYPLLKTPVFNLVYAEPPAEEIKQRSETHSAYINFELAKHALLPNYKNNAQVLAEVDKIVTELRNDENLTINELKITGYASPEGGYDFNMKLSENRAKAFVKFLQDKYRNTIPSNLMTVDWKGEDWDGLRKQIEASNHWDKAAILEVLNEPNNTTRKNKIKQLSGGKTYKDLLENYYPVLRRNDYTISYVSKPFSVEEAKEVIKTKPQHLSLNEMFHVANSYPKDSPEFKETFDIIAKMYPGNEYSILNMGIYEIENNAYNSGVEKLMRIDKPEAWNALGVAYYNMNDYSKAEQYLNRAANAGLEIGIQNLRSYNDSMSNNQTYF